MENQKSHFSGCRVIIAAILGVSFSSLAIESRVAQVQAAHGLEAWKRTEVLACSLNLEFGGKPALSGALYFETNGPRSRLDLVSGETILFDGKTAWLSPDSSAFKRARFHVLTWSWFIAAPFKLRGGGSRLSPFDTVQWEGRRYLTSVQTFEAGSGDTPDDWYHIYIDPESNSIRGMGYIITYGKPRIEAEKDPHGILYEDYRSIGGVLISTRWRFAHFSRQKGFSGNLGSGRISDLRFIKAGEMSFDKPGNAREEVLP